MSDAPDAVIDLLGSPDQSIVVYSGCDRWQEVLVPQLEGSFHRGVEGLGIDLVDTLIVGCRHLKAPVKLVKP